MGVRDLCQGMQGEDVRAIQKALNEWGANPALNPDGKFGGLTDTAVRRFQDAHQLNHDGIVGEKTRRALFPVGVVTATIFGMRLRAPRIPSWRDVNRPPGSGLLSPGPYVTLDPSLLQGLGYGPVRFPLLTPILHAPVTPDLTAPPGPVTAQPAPTRWVYDHLELQPGAQSTFTHGGPRQDMFILTAQFVYRRGPDNGAHWEADGGVQIGVPLSSPNDPWTFNPYVQITDVDRFGSLGAFHWWQPYAQAGVQVVGADNLRPSLTGSLFPINLGLDIGERLTLSAGAGVAFTMDLGTGNVQTGLQISGGLTLKLGKTDN
jgi:hypothetical protein